MADALFEAVFYVNEAKIASKMRLIENLGLNTERDLIHTTFHTNLFYFNAAVRL
jgi:hypothetical protein